MVFRYAVLTVILLPMVLSSISLITLNYLYSRADSLIISEQQTARSLRLLVSAFDSGLAYERAAFLENIERTEHTLSKVARDRASFSSDLTKLSGSIDGDDTFKDCVRNLDNQVAQDVAEFASAGESDSDTTLGLPRRSIMLASLMVRDVFRLGKLALSCQQQRSLRFDESRKVQTKITSQLKQLSNIGFGGSFVLASILAMAVSIFARNRFSHLRHRVRDIVTHSSASPPLSGRDELAVLDQVMVMVSQRLVAVQAHRKSMLEVVSHDVRSPIASATVAISIVERNSDLPRDLIALAQAELKTANEFVTRLLESNRLESSDQAEEWTKGWQIATAKSSKLPEPNLIQKLVILICLPLCLQAYWFVTSVHQISDKERLYYQYIQRVQTSNASFEIGFRNAQAFAAAALYKATGKPKFKLAAMEQLDRVGTLVVTLQRLLANQQGENPNDWKPVFDLSLSIRRFLDSKLTPDMPLTPIMNQADSLDERMIDAESIFERTMAHSFKTERAMLDLSDLQLALSAKSRTAISVGLVLNFLLAITLMLLFSRQIGKRMQTVIENACAIPCKRADWKEVGGSDELYRLDQLLFHANAALVAADAGERSTIAAVAENISRPLMMALGHIDCLRLNSAGTLNESSQRNLKDAKADIEEVLVMIAELLGASSLESTSLTLTKQPHDISEIVNQAKDLVAYQAQIKNIKIRDACEACVIWVDRSRMVQVLVNLLTNAVKFSPDNTTVVIACDERDHEIGLSVTDEGPGLEPELIEHLFDRFARGEHSEGKEGFGLGLAISKLIVEHHGGRISVSNNPTGGAKFTVTIPKPVDGSSAAELSSSPSGKESVAVAVGTGARSVMKPLAVTVLALVTTAGVVIAWTRYINHQANQDQLRARGKQFLSSAELLPDNGQHTTEKEALLKEAVRCLEKVPAAKSELVKSLVLLARQQTEGGSPEDSYETATRALRLANSDGNHPLLDNAHLSQLWYDIGRDSGALGDGVGAAEAFEKHLQLLPPSANPMNDYAGQLELGRTYRLIRAWKKAIPHILATLNHPIVTEAQKKDRVMTESWLAQCYLESGDREKARYYAQSVVSQTDSIARKPSSALTDRDIIYLVARRTALDVSSKCSTAPQ